MSTPPLLTIATWLNRVLFRKLLGAQSARMLALYTMFCMLFALCGPAISFAGAAHDLSAVTSLAAETEGKPLSRQEFLDQATQASRSAQDTQRLADGQVRVRVPLQALEAKIGPTGMQLNSIDAAGSAAFGWKLAAWGREHDTLGSMQTTQQGTVEQKGDQVWVTRGGVQEQFSTSSNGLRQDFVIAERPAGTTDLVLRLHVQAASLQALDNTDQAVAIELEDGRLLHYHALLVTDATGATIPASMQVSDERTLRIAVQDQQAQYPLRVDPTFSDADWTSLAGPDFDVAIQASIFADGHLYVGGGFTATPNGPARHIAQWDGSTWSALGAGIDGDVIALAWDETGNRLFAAEYFITADGDSAGRVWQWNGSAWSALGSELYGGVLALAWDGENNRLFAGGGGDTANHTGYVIAQWNGAAWSTLGTGVNGAVFALAWDEAGNRLFAGGNFTTAGGISVNNIAQWNGAAWSALDTGVTGVDLNTRVSALVWDGTGNRLFAAGVFSHAGAVPANNIAQWDGAAWSALGAGRSVLIYALAMDEVGNRLFVGGTFSSSGGAAAGRIAQWDGTDWTALETTVTFDDGNSVYALAWDGNRLFSGGTFTSAGGVAASRIAQWDGSAWSALGTGMNRNVFALAWDEVGNRLFAGGSFITAGGVTASHIAQWDGSAWSSLGTGMNGRVRTLAWDETGNRLFVGGEFTYAGGAPAKSIAQWNGTAWSALSTGMDGVVYALAWDDAGGRLFAGGNFTSAGGARANRIAQWDGSTWSALGTGMDRGVSSLAWDREGKHLFAGGEFNTAGSVAASRIAQWDGSAWSALGTGMNFNVYALAWDEAGNRLFAGGDFTSAGGADARRIAQWDGLAWSVLDAGMDRVVYALAWDEVGNRLFAGGTFTSAGGVAANRIAQWDGSAWSALGTGMNGGVEALVWDRAGSRLLAGGYFSTAGGLPAKVAAAYFPVTYTLSYAAAANGSITGNDSQTVIQGADGTAVTAVPNYGYRFVEWSDGLTTATRTDTNVTANVTVTATFAQNTYTLAYTAGANGTITGAASQTITHGSSGTAVTAVPDAGYHFVEWSDGNTNATRTDEDVTANLSVEASFVARSTSYTGALPDGSQAIVTIENAAGTCEYTSAVLNDTIPAGAPQGYDFPMGAWQFEAQGCPGNTTVRIQYANALPADAVFYKYGSPAAGAAVAWFELGVSEVTLNAARDTVSYVVVDNGRGDSNTQQDFIRDPFMVAVKTASPALVTPTPVPSLGTVAIVLLNLIAAMFAGLGLRSRRRARATG